MKIDKLKWAVESRVDVLFYTDNLNVDQEIELDKLYKILDIINDPDWIVTV